MSKQRKPVPAKTRSTPAAKEAPKDPGVVAEAPPPAERVVLHVGCGKATGILEHPLFKNGSTWKELRLDIDPTVNPDVVADIRDMKPVPSESVDAIWSSHNIEHVYPHESAQVLSEFFRVIKPGGFVYIATPDLQAVCEPVAQGKLDETLYVSPSGPISAIDILYGHRKSLTNGHIYMAHHNGFTATSLGKLLRSVGFYNVHMQRNGYHLYAFAQRLAEDAPNKQSGIRVTNLNAKKSAANDASAPPPPRPQGGGLPDELDRPPLIWQA